MKVLTKDQLSKVNGGLTAKEAQQLALDAQRRLLELNRGISGDSSSNRSRLPTSGLGTS